MQDSSIEEIIILTQFSTGGAGFRYLANKIVFN